ncbi:MAG TPA: hypothetical protein VL307_12550 [Chitinophagaceae bacterium]|nr:hypothetical protein [Chitinophagaceae bacterium]
MKQLSILAIASTMLLLNACSGGHTAEKRVVVMASGKLTVADKTITLDPSLTHNEQELVFPDDKLTLNLKTTSGINKTFDLTEPGVYLLNLQTDTLIGGLVNYGTLGMPGSITAEEMDHIIDSTQQLMQGTNASDAKSTYFILPMTIKKISAKSNTKVVGSFKGIPYKNEAGEDGKLPDVIKFFSVKQKRETLKDLMEQRAKIKINH